MTTSYNIYRPYVTIAPYTPINIPLEIREKYHTQLTAIIHTWLVSHGWILKDKENSNIVDRGFRDYIVSLNFRSLINSEALDKLASAIIDTDITLTTNRIIDLWNQIRIDIDHGYLTDYIHRLYTTLDDSTQDITIDHTWEYIHNNYPYLWVIYLIQRGMRNSG